MTLSVKTFGFTGFQSHFLPASASSSDPVPSAGHAFIAINFAERDDEDMMRLIFDDAGCSGEPCIDGFP